MFLEENKNLVRRIFEEVFNQGKLELASELLADDFVNHTMPGKSGVVLLLEMVDNSIGPLRTHFGLVFSPLVCPVRVCHP